MTKEQIYKRQVSDDEILALQHSLEQFREIVYLNTEIGKLPESLLGIQTSFIKVPPEDDSSMPKRLKETRDTKFEEELLQNGNNQQNSIFSANEETVLETFGFWDWVTIRYRDDLYDLTQGDERRMEGTLGFKSFCGTVLATNSGVKAGQILERPLAPRGAEHKCLLAHYKLNPFLLFTGRSDLITHTAQFIALLLAGDDDFWNSRVAEIAWSRVIEKMNLNENKLSDLKTEIRDDLIGNARRLAKNIEFLILQNLDWHDVSIYLMGDNTANLARLGLYFREMPIFCPRFVSSFKSLFNEEVNALRSTKRAARIAISHLGSVLDLEAAKRAEDDLSNIMRDCRKLFLEEQPEGHWPDQEPTEFIPELSVFCDYTDVLTLPQKAEADVRYVQRLNVKASRMRQLQEALDGRTGRPLLFWGRGLSMVRRFLGMSEDPISKMQIMSGPVDVALLSLDRLQQHSELLYEKSTLALVPLAGTPLHVRRHPRGSIFSTLRPLLKSSFQPDDWKKVDILLSKLFLPRTTIRALRTIIIQHLSYKSDPIMVNALYDYLHLWRNLQRQLLDTLKNVASSPNNDLSIVRCQLSKNLTLFVEKISQAINARYHGSGRMFEVTDLNHNHKGGAEFLLNAYSQMFYRVIRACDYIDWKSHIGIVKVGEGGAAQIFRLFGNIIEIDWLKLSCPENSFIIVHEAGHSLIKDKIFSFMYEYLLNDDSWREITNKGQYTLSPWSYPKKIQELLEDVFCDLFMIYITAASLGQKLNGTLRKDLKDFYDKFFWTQAEMQFATASGADPDFIPLQIVRWYCVHCSIDYLYPLEGKLVKDHRNTRESLRRYLSDVEAKTKAVADIHDRDIQKPILEFLDFNKTDVGAPVSGEMFLPLIEIYEELNIINAPSDKEWCYEYLPIVEKYCTGVARLHNQQNCVDCDERCRESDELKCEAFRSDTLDRLYSFLRPTDTSGNPIQLFILFCHFFLDCIVNLDRSKGLRSIRDAYHLNLEIFEQMFNDPDKLLSYAQYTDSGFLEPQPERPYAPIIINPRGSTVIFDPKLRERFFSQRLNMLNRLSEDRLQRVAEQIKHSIDNQAELT